MHLLETVEEPEVNNLCDRVFIDRVYGITEMVERTGIAPWEVDKTDLCDVGPRCLQVWVCRG